MDLDLSGIVDAFASDYTVTRSSARVIDGDGYPSTTSSSTFTIRASVQPLSGRDLLRLPEGQRADEMIKIYTATELFTSGAAQEADVMTVGGTAYQVSNVQRWSDADGGYWRVMLQKVGAP